MWTADLSAVVKCKHGRNTKIKKTTVWRAEITNHKKTNRQAGLLHESYENFNVMKELCQWRCLERDKFLYVSSVFFLADWHGRAKPELFYCTRTKPDFSHQTLKSYVIVLRSELFTALGSKITGDNIPHTKLKSILLAFWATQSKQRRMKQLNQWWPKTIWLHSQLTQIFQLTALIILPHCSKILT